MTCRLWDCVGFSTHLCILPVLSCSGILHWTFDSSRWEPPSWSEESGTSRPVARHNIPAERGTRLVNCIVSIFVFRVYFNVPAADDRRLGTVFILSLTLHPQSFDPCIFPNQRRSSLGHTRVSQYRHLCVRVDVDSRRWLMLFAAVLVDCFWNVMAHAQNPDFVFRRNGRVHLNQRGRQFVRLLAAEVCASAVVMLDTPCSEVVWRVLATHSIRQFPLHFPSCASPCAITFKPDSKTTWSASWVQQSKCVRKKKKKKIVLTGHCVKYFFTWATARRTVYCETRGRERERVCVYCKISPFTRRILEIRHLDVR